MNELSWLLYLACMCSQLQTLFYILSLILGTATVFSGIVLINNHDDPELALLAKYTKRLVVLVPVLLIVAGLMPDKETMYLIAASESGEKVIKSETGQKAVKAIDAYLDKVSKSSNN